MPPSEISERHQRFDGGGTVLLSASGGHAELWYGAPRQVAARLRASGGFDALAGLLQGRSGVVAYLATVAVARERRGSGLGGQLVRAALGAAASEGASAVYLHARPDDLDVGRLVAFYERLGMRREAGLDADLWPVLRADLRPAAPARDASHQLDLFERRPNPGPDDVRARVAALAAIARVGLGTMRSLQDDRPELALYAADRWVTEGASPADLAAAISAAQAAQMDFYLLSGRDGDPWNPPGRADVELVREAEMGRAVCGAILRALSLALGPPGRGPRRGDDEAEVRQLVAAWTRLGEPADAAEAQLRLAAASAALRPSNTSVRTNPPLSSDVRRFLSLVESFVAGDGFRLSTAQQHALVSSAIQADGGPAGSGKDRAAFEVDQVIVKVPLHTWGAEVNRRESERWRQADARDRAWLVPVVDAHPEGLWLVMRRAEEGVPREWFERFSAWWHGGRKDRADLPRRALLEQVEHASEPSDWMSYGGKPALYDYG